MARVSRRAHRVGASLLCVALLGFSAVYSHLAPFGMWVNRIFGEPAWYEFDPASFYMSAAHEFHFGESARFVGHPGTPLFVLLAAVQHLLYAMHGGAQLSFTEYALRHLPSVYLASKLLVTLLQLLSFWALFAFARQLLRDELAAWWSVLGYATSLPVFYYASRISVEPLMMSCFFGTFLALWRYEELARQGRERRALAFAGLASAAAVTGAVTKLAFLAPLPGLALFLAAVGPRGAGRVSIAGRTRVRALLAMVLVGLAVLGFWSQWIDWPRFFHAWSSFPGIWSAQKRAWSLLPAPTPGGALPLCELCFVSVGGLGLLRLLRRQGEPRARLLWICAYAAFGLAGFASRVALERNFLPFHYFMLPSVVFALGFGDVSASVLRRFSGSAPRAVLVGVLWLAAIHGLAIGVVVDSRQRAAEEYAVNRPFFELLARIGPAERLGVRAKNLNTPEFRRGLLSLFGGFTGAPDAPRGTPILRPELEALFVPIRATRPGQEQRLLVPALHAEVVVVGDDAPRGRP
jgi:hypothetical protein